MRFLFHVLSFFLSFQVFSWILINFHFIKIFFWSKCSTVIPSYIHKIQWSINLWLLIFSSLLMRHLLLPTQLPERHWIPWPISINEWTPRIFSFVRSRDNSTISFPRSTLKAHWVLPLHLLRMLIYICVCVCVCVFVLFVSLIWICAFFLLILCIQNHFFFAIYILLYL